MTTPGEIDPEMKLVRNQEDVRVQIINLEAMSKDSMDTFLLVGVSSKRGIMASWRIGPGQSGQGIKDLLKAIRTAYTLATAELETLLKKVEEAN